MRWAKSVLVNLRCGFPLRGKASSALGIGMSAFHAELQSRIGLPQLDIWSRVRARIVSLKVLIVGAKPF